MNKSTAPLSNIILTGINWAAHSTLSTVDLVFLKFFLFLSFKNMVFYTILYKFELMPFICNHDSYSLPFHIQGSLL